MNSSIDKSKRGMKRFSFILLSLLLFQNVAFSTTIKEKFVSIGDAKIWVETVGDKKPTILLLNGENQSLESWQFLLPKLSRVGSVFMYDRADTGRSQPLSNQIAPRSAKFVVTRLQKILKASDVKPPYILVSSGLASSYARYFARKYPRQVRGLVLINPDVNAAIAMGYVRHYKKGEKAQQSNFRRHYNHNLFLIRETVNERHLRHKYQFTYKQSQKNAALLEVLGMSKSEEQIRRLGPFPKVPLLILEGKQDSRLETQMMMQMIKKTNKGHYQYVDFNSDELQKFSPETIVAGIKKVM